MQAYSAGVSSRKAPKRPTSPTDIWVVWVDHSHLGIWLSEGAAMNAVVQRRQHNELTVEYRIAHYVLKGDK